MMPSSFGVRAVGRLGAPSLFLFVLALAACIPGEPPAPAPEPGVQDTAGPREVTPDPRRPVRLQILHTNDVHGRLLPQVVDGDTIGGAAVLSAHLDSLRARFDGPTVVLSGGDIMQGTAISNLAWGRPLIEVHNRKGYHAAVLGNHEFDWGLDTLRARVGESEFPWLAANIHGPEGTDPPDWFRPWIVWEEDGVRVGIVGIALASTPEVVIAGRTEDLVFSDEAQALRRAVSEVLGQGVDFVVALTHVGAICSHPGEEPEERSQGCEGLAMDVLREAGEGVDVFLAAHTHARNLAEVDGTLLLQSPAYTEGISVARLERAAGLERTAGNVEVTYAAIIPPRAVEVDPDTAMARVVDEWVARVGPILDEPVAELAEPFSNAERRAVENPAGNLMADAQRWATGADVGLVNNGSLRRGLPQGPVTFGILYEFQPFQNELVRIEVDGALLREILEFGLTEAGEPWTHISGLRVRYDPRAPEGERITSILRDDGTPVAPRDRLTIGTSEFLAAGGDGYVALAQGRIQRTGVVDVDALIEYLRHLGDPVGAPATGRWDGS
ncbi:MAG: hypothetical protein EA422_06085 [Gemmatimonadales bacterium]|nr:MAG: hypothetical protein EA422_06085 [Gemmatimonadales bacterium]